MILALTNSEDATSDYLLPVLADAGIPFLRLDTDTLISSSTLSYCKGSPVFTVKGQRLSPKSISHIWYRRPERLKDARFDDTPEGSFAINEWSEAIEGFLAHVPRSKWMNHPSINVAASSKLEQLSSASSLGIKIPDTLMTQDEWEAKAFFERHGGKVIVKPMSNGYIDRNGETDSLIYTNRVERHHLENDEDIINCPTLFQQYIPKVSDVRITVVDNDMHALALHASDGDGQQRCDIRRNNMTDVAYNQIKLPPPISNFVSRLVNRYELRFAAIDMAVDVDGNWVFFEVNPNGQWAWLDLSAGAKIATSFVKSFSNA